MSIFKISNRAKKITSSAIREILKVANAPGVISFAGGVPSPQTFPIEELKNAFQKILKDDSIRAFQYGPTEGYLPLREWIANKHKTHSDSVLITTGSQQALDLVAKVLIEPHEPILVESPTYLGALQAFSLFDPLFVSVPYDSYGVNADGITDERALNARFIYVMPNYQNPTGTVMSLERRKRLIKKMSENNIPIVEDDPYRDLFYSGESIETLYSMNQNGVIYLGSFSKILAPGLRVGYIIAPREIMTKLIQVKQAADLHTPILNQQLAYEVLGRDFQNNHLKDTRAFYSKQCGFMLSALDNFMPENVSWTIPKGGMFVWLTISNCICAQSLLELSLSSNNITKVAFVPGSAFYSENPNSNTLRLSFATVSEEKIILGIKHLAQIIINQSIDSR